MLQLKEQEILDRARSKANSQLLEEVFEESRAKLLRAISNRVGTRMRQRVNPSDVLQEAYISAAQRLDRYLENPSVPMISWVQSICFQIISIFYKKHFVAKKRSVLLQHDQLSESYSTWIFQDSATSPSARLVKAEEQSQLLALVSKMSENDQAILYLRHVDDRTIREAANLLEIPVETAKKRYSRAIKKLIKLTEGTMEEVSR